MNRCGRNVYIFDNKEFYSLRELSEYVHINEKTLTARLRKGMSVEDACEKTDLRCSYYLENGVRESISQICKEQGREEYLIRNRLRYGYSMNDALNTPKRITKQGTQIVVNGILYNSVSSALKKLDLSHKESTVRRRLKSGMAPDAAFNFNDY